MNGFKLKKRDTNRFLLFLCATFVGAVTTLCSGIGISYSGQEPATAKKAEVNDPAAAKRKAAAAVRARAQRDAAVKRRHDSKEYIKKVVEGQQPGATVAAPSNAGKEGAK